MWLTINPNDTHDPVAQVIAGEDIDLDDFVATSGPIVTICSINIAADPYALAKFFHLIARCTLDALTGIHMKTSPGRHIISHEKGIFGRVRCYVRTVEAQGRGSLHMHVLLWLCGSMTSSAMETALKTKEFRDRVSNFISQNIVGDINNMTAEEIVHHPKLKEPMYSRPPKPTMSNPCTPENLARLARTLQVHSCHDLRCLIKFNNHKICKRWAPFPRSNKPWIDESGEWGLKRLYGYVNNFNPPILVCVRSNYDIKLITNAFGTNNITWYITTYATKKQSKSSNASAILTKTIAFHKATDHASNDARTSNKHLLQRCSNTLGRLQEFSAQEVIGYVMGWGDRYLSHHYIPIYMNGIWAAIFNAFPLVRHVNHFVYFDELLTLMEMKVTTE